MSLFAALFPPRPARESLRAAILSPGEADGLRWQPASRWHVTLGFYGDADAGGGSCGSGFDAGRVRERADWLGARLAGRPPVVLRIAGGGSFPGVLWAGIEGEGLRDPAVAAGADVATRQYRPHVTLARWPRTETPAALGDRARRLDGYTPGRTGELARWHSCVANEELPACVTWWYADFSSAVRRQGSPVRRRGEQRASGLLISSIVGSGCSPWRP